MVCLFVASATIEPENSIVADATKGYVLPIVRALKDTATLIAPLRGKEFYFLNFV
jgi:hypothetical protein